MPDVRALVVSASMGAGHDAAARALSGQLAARDVEVRTVDWLALAGRGQGPALRGFYRAMVRHAPAAYDLAMRQWTQHPAFFERVTAVGARGHRRALLAAVAAFEPQVVVSTYNLAAQALGRWRDAGVLGVPVVSCVTDPGPHPYWVARGADRHLAPLASTAAALTMLGAADVHTVAPLVDDRFRRRVDRLTVRQRWRLPAADRVALVTGGSWGVGEVASVAAALATEPGTTPVVLCGRSDALRRQVEGVRGAVALGWTDEVADLMAGCDVLVDSAGGATCWEALAAGLAVVLHRVIPGHGRLNAAALSVAGLARCTTSVAELREAVQAARPPAVAATLFDAPQAAGAVVQLC